jgi:hypothetical protein
MKRKRREEEGERDWEGKRRRPEKREERQRTKGKATPHDGYCCVCER